MNEQKKLLEQLVRREIAPNNEFVAYLVEKAQDSLAELDQVIAHKKRLMAMASENLTRETQLRSTLDAYAIDISHWQEKEKIDETVNKTNVGDDLGED
jgi:hypothetical protein